MPLGPYSLRVRFITRTDEADNLHAYVLIATLKSSEGQDPAIERFLTSFKVLPGRHLPPLAAPRRLSGIPFRNPARIVALLRQQAAHGGEQLRAGRGLEYHDRVRNGGHLLT
jgi:hypothetical protein